MFSSLRKSTMDFVNFDPKRDGLTRVPPLHLPEGTFEADVWMGETIVRGEEAGSIMNRQGCYGHFLMDQPILANKSCFTTLRRHPMDDTVPETSSEVSTLEIPQEPDIPVPMLDSESSASPPPNKKQKKESHTTPLRDSTENLRSENIDSSLKKEVDSGGHVNNVKKVRTYDEDAYTWWNNLLPCDSRLRLSCFETIFLVKEKILTVFYKSSPVDISFLWGYFCEMYGKDSFPQSCAVYMKLREFGWVPRCGLSFGCDFLLYKTGPAQHHASAGVKIVSGFTTPYEMIALNRQLRNVKKSLFQATVTYDTAKDPMEVSILSSMHVEFLAQTTFMPEQNREL